ncbi:hypothetical protein B0H11DRAFT_1652014, partial [Mycena galericulata]
FTSSHFNGPVTYSTDDALNPDFVSLLCRESDTGTGGSVNPFIKGLFSGRRSRRWRPRNEDTIVAAQQPVKPMRTVEERTQARHAAASSARRHAVVEGDERERVELVRRAYGMASGITCCVCIRCVRAGCFCSQYSPCLQVYLSQKAFHHLEDELRAAYTEEQKRNRMHDAKVGMVVGEFCERYAVRMAESGAVEGDEREWERVEQAQTAYGMGERGIVLGVHKVRLPLAKKAFHHLEDELRAADTEQKKRNRMRDAEVKGMLGIYNDPYPHSSPAA